MTRERYLGLVAAIFVGGFVGGLLSGAVMDYAPAGPAADPVPQSGGAFNPRADDIYGDPPETICAKKIVILDDGGNTTGVWSNGGFVLRSPGLPHGEGARIALQVNDAGAQMWVEAEAAAAKRNAGIYVQAMADRAFVQSLFRDRVLGEFKPQK